MDNERAELRQVDEDMGDRGSGTDFRQMIKANAKRLSGNPGRPRKGSHRQQSLSTIKGTTRTTLFNWETGATVPRPRKLAEHLIETGQTGSRAVPYWVRYFPVFIEKQVRLAQQWIPPTLLGRDGQVAAAFGVDVSVRTWSAVLENNAMAQDRELEEAQRLMGTSLSKFGWVTLGPNLAIAAPSRPICALLGLDRQEFTASFLIDEPLLGRLEAMLENYGEWLLIITMMVNSLAEQWQEAGLTQHVDRAMAFFERVKDYVSNPDHRVSEQVAAAPALVDNQVPRAVLEQCLQAAQGLEEWPEFQYGGWNSMRMYVKKHELLPAGQIARFIKIGRPKPTQERPIGFEVEWLPEDWNHTASQLLRDVLQTMENPT